MLAVSDVAKSFAGKTVIASASLTLAAGEILVLTGPSGVGKSTLLEIAAGVTAPDSGRVRRGAEPALMFQDNALIPWLTARENILYILPPDAGSGTDGRTGRETLTDRADRWLGRFQLDADQYPAAMSGGMRRRLSLARTFAAGRKLILLDEPFAFLDAQWQRLIAEEIAAHAGAGCAVLLTTHATGPLERWNAGRPWREIAVNASPAVIGGGVAAGNSARPGPL